MNAVKMIDILLRAGEDVELVNGRGARIRITGTFHGLGVYDSTGRFVSAVTLDVDGFTFTK